MNKVKIFDMDGVLVDSSPRYKLNKAGRIDLQHWIDNEHKHVFDTLLPTSNIYTKALLSDDTLVIIATARDLTYHDQHKWIAENLGYPDYVVSRNGRDDTRGGVQLKSEGILKILEETGLENAIKYMWEDNATYLLGVCQNIDAIPRFVKSNQGY